MKPSETRDERANTQILSEVLLQQVARPSQTTVGKSSKRWEVCLPVTLTWREPPPGRPIPDPNSKHDKMHNSAHRNTLLSHKLPSKQLANRPFWAMCLPTSSPHLPRLTPTSQSQNHMEASVPLCTKVSFVSGLCKISITTCHPKGKWMQQNGASTYFYMGQWGGFHGCFMNFFALWRGSEKSA